MKPGRKSRKDNTAPESLNYTSVEEDQTPTKPDPNAPLPSLLTLWAGGGGAGNDKVKAVVTPEQQNLLLETSIKTKDVTKLTSKLRQMPIATQKKTHTESMDGLLEIDPRPNNILSRLNFPVSHNKSRSSADNNSRSQSQIQSSSGVHGTGAALPDDFEYDLTLYNSPQSKGVLSKSKVFRLIPHPPANENRWRKYKVGAELVPEIDHLNRNSLDPFADLDEILKPPVPPPRVSKRNQNYEEEQETMPPPPDEAFLPPVPSRRAKTSNLRISGRSGEKKKIKSKKSLLSELSGGSDSTLDFGLSKEF